ncbi:hypothetical protein TrLO_g9392 [Triparma laevis f. longispina]|uniref:Trafficking protein particle complex subunit 6B n=1 Tax=Triparma laevis f. longispina TaxID=1714387 RepID=A0A9W7FR05_9STRA|nr:hypothetical protein TrLO_g9392 [Triparma laevis f. longispina]
MSALPPPLSIIPLEPLESNYNRPLDRQIPLTTLSTPYVSRDLFELLLSSIITQVVSQTSPTTTETTQSSEASAALIEAMGYSVGLRVAPLLLLPDMNDNGRSNGEEGSENEMGNPQALPAPPPLPGIDPGNSLSIVKYLCKDFWVGVFGKQIDKLQTNHRGVFVLKDYSFSLLKRIPTTTSPTSPSPLLSDSSRILAIRILAYPCGLIRGALSSFGFKNSVVSCDFLNDGRNVESTSFNIRIQS